MGATSFVPGWAVSVPLLILAAVVLWACIKASHEPDDDPRC